MNRTEKAAQAAIVVPKCRILLMIFPLFRKCQGGQTKLQPWKGTTTFICESRLPLPPLLIVCTGTRYQLAKLRLKKAPKPHKGSESSRCCCNHTARLKRADGATRYAQTFSLAHDEVRVLRIISGKEVAMLSLVKCMDMMVCEGAGRA